MEYFKMARLKLNDRHHKALINSKTYAKEISNLYSDAVRIKEKTPTKEAIKILNEVEDAIIKLYAARSFVLFELQAHQKHIKAELAKAKHDRENCELAQNEVGLWIM